MAIDYGKRAGLRGSGLYYLDTGLNPSWNEEARELESNNPPTLTYPDDFDRSIKPYYGQSRSPVLNGYNGIEENSAYQHGQNSNDDAATNARYQELAQRESELKEEILKLETEIAWQEKLRDNEMSGDPMWEVAKQQYVQKGDSSALESIMSRRATAAENKKSRESQEAIAKINAKKESADKQEANERSARFARNNLNDALIYYETVKGDSEKRILAANDLLARKNQFMEAAEISGKEASEYLKDDPEFLQRVDAAINEGRSTQSAKIDTTNANYTKNKKAWDANAKKALDRYNKLRANKWTYQRIEEEKKEILKYLNVDSNGNATVKPYSGG